MSSLRSFHVVALLITMLVAGCDKAHPPDRVMEEFLQSHKSDFDRLIEMLDEDSDVVRLGHDFVFFEKDTNREKLPAERTDEYRRLFGKLNLENGVHRPRPGVITLIASSNDGVFSKSEKSYVHSETALSPQVDSLDQVAEATNGDHPPVYKKLTNDWYLFYERW